MPKSDAQSIDSENIFIQIHADLVKQQFLYEDEKIVFFFLHHNRLVIDTCYKKKNDLNE